MPKGKDLGLNRSASSKSLPNGTEQRENDRKHSICKLSFLPCKFNWLYANEVFSMDSWLTLFPTDGWARSFPTRCFSDQPQPHEMDENAGLANSKAHSDMFMEAQEEAQKEAAEKVVSPKDNFSGTVRPSNVRFGGAD